MQAGKADSQNRAKGNREYAADKPRDCRHCYFWKGKQKGCSRKECYYLLSEDSLTPGTALGEAFQQKEDGTYGGSCQGCPYGRHSPCIGYCMKKILWEIRQKKQSAGKEGGTPCRTR